MKPTKLNLLLLSSSLLVGCMAEPDRDLDSAEAAVESTDTAEAEGNVVMGVLEGADTSALASLTADQIAARLAANVAGRWSPSGCATVTQSGSTISIAFANCTGPRGLASVNGTLSLEVSVAADGSFTVHATSTDLRVNQLQLTIDATATHSPMTHTLTVNTRGSAVGPRGNTVAREGDYTITWEPASQCRSIAGAWSTERELRSRMLNVDLERCADGCPTGTVTRALSTGASMTITFDGTSTASWSTAGGASGTIDLPCR
jgi:hypothetical protein